MKEYTFVNLSPRFGVPRFNLNSKVWLHLRFVDFFKLKVKGQSFSKDQQKWALDMTEYTSQSFSGICYTEYQQTSITEKLTQRYTSSFTYPWLPICFVKPFLTIYEKVLKCGSGLPFQYLLFRNLSWQKTAVCILMSIEFPL